MYEQKSKREGKKVKTQHVRYIGKGHHGGYQGPSQAVVPNAGRGTDPVFYPVYAFGGVSKFDAAPTRDPFPNLKDKRTVQGKNTVLFTQIKPGNEDAVRSVAAAKNEVEGQHAKVIRDRGTYFYVETTTGGGAKARKDQTGLVQKSDKFNKGIRASEASRVVPKLGPKRKGIPDKGGGRGDVKIGFGSDKAPSQEAAPKSQARRDTRSNAIDAQFTVKSEGGQ